MSLVDFHETVAWQPSVENLRTEYHENPIDDLILILGDGRTEIVVSTYNIFTL